MAVTEFGFRLALLFLPGIITFLIIEKLTFRQSSSPIDIFLRSFIYSFLCYSAYYFLTLISKLNLQFSFLNNLTSKDPSISFKEIFISTSFSIPIGLLLSFLSNNQILNKVAEIVKVTKKRSDLDVWSDIMLSSPRGEWIQVKDLKSELFYDGWIEHFSTKAEIIELFLREVSIYGKGIENADNSVHSAIYLCFKREDIIVYFPLRPTPKRNNEAAKEIESKEVEKNVVDTSAASD